MDIASKITFKHAYVGSEAQALSLFALAPFARIAGVDEDGDVLLRTVHTAVVDGRIAFHAGDHGQKRLLLGRRVTAMVEQVVAEIPSTFIDPVLACPATTYFESAMAMGTLCRVEDLNRKARILTALMERFQPEGGHAPIRADDARYTSMLSSLLVAEVVPERLVMKNKLGQNRSVQQIEGVLRGLWNRGSASDLAAIRKVSEAHPARPTPPFLTPGSAHQLCVSPDARDAARVVELLQGQYWTADLSREQLRDALLGSDAWVVARDAQGEVVASARAVSDGARFAMLFDVIVRPDLRGQGLGRAVVRCLLDHPRLRHVRAVHLRTRDAHAFYAGFGFVTQADPLHMQWLRPAQQAS